MSRDPLIRTLLALGLLGPVILCGILFVRLDTVERVAAAACDRAAAAERRAAEADLSRLDVLQRLETILARLPETR